MKENYTYAAIFDYSEEGYININFPMFDSAATFVEVGEDPIPVAQDILSLNILNYEDEGLELPPESIKPGLEKNQEVVFINVWMPYHRGQVKEVYIKKTLTIPAWLDLLAKQNNMNFSAVLVKALKKELKIK